LIPYPVHDQVQNGEAGLITQMQIIDYQDYWMFLGDGL
jgi:hypothetical protein